MQVVVRRNDLANPNPVVIATYNDDIFVDIAALGLTDDIATVLTVPASAISYPANQPPTLASSWRDNGQMTTNAEAFRRIERVFSSYAQRNANADMVDCVTKYGADSATWPQDARERKTLADQGWDYVNSVRQQSNALGPNMPVDVTHDSHWPTEIPRINYPTT
jgi:hypothetical protein